MEVYYFSKEFEVSIVNSDKKIVFRGVGNQKAAIRDLYFSTFSCARKLIQALENNPVSKMHLLNAEQKKKMFSAKHFPKYIGCSTPEFCEIVNFNACSHKELHKIPESAQKNLFDLLSKAQKTKVKILCINGMGTGFGDALVGLRACEIANQIAKKINKQIEWHMAHISALQTEIHRDFYFGSNLVSEIVDLPAPVNKLFDYDFYTDFSGIVAHQGFDKSNLIDHFLKNLGIQPDTVCNADKKPNICVTEKSNALARNVLKHYKFSKYVVLHTASSTPVRSLPEVIAHKLAEDLLNSNPDLNLLFTDANECMTDCIESKFKHRVCNAKSFINGNLQNLFAFVANSSAVITPDTLTLHVAAAFEKPTYAIFTTVDPATRISYYKNCNFEKITDMQGIHFAPSEQEQKIVYQSWRSWVENTEKIKGFINAHTINE